MQPRLLQQRIHRDTIARHSYRTPTGRKCFWFLIEGIKFLIVSKPSILSLDTILDEIYTLFADYVMKVVPSELNDM